MKKERKKKQRRTAKQSKQEFTVTTRVYDLVKSEFHDEVKLLTKAIKPYVKNVATIDWKHLKYFEYDDEKICKTDFILLIAEFLLAISKGDGLKCKMSVFLRYLSQNEHSNFGLKYKSLNTLIYRMFSYLEGKKKEAKKL